MTFVFHKHPDITMLGDFLNQRHGHAFFQHDRHKSSPGHVRRHKFIFGLADLHFLDPTKANDPDRVINFSNFPDILKVFVKFLIGDSR